MFACLQVYGEAAAVYAALDQRFQSERGGMFFFGSRPSSLDALLFSHLSYQLGAPSSAPELRQAVGWPEPVAHVHLNTAFVHRLTGDLMACAWESLSCVAG